MRASIRSSAFAVSLSFTLALAACSGSSTPAGQQAAPAASTAAAPAPASAPATDPEFEQVKAAKPLVACDLITLEEVSAVYPGLKFTVKQNMAPQMSGYAWDSRCEYEAGVGTIEFAKTQATHSVQVFATTVATEAKAQSNLKSRAESMAGESAYKAQPEMGASAYTIARTGTVSLYTVKGQTEIQLLVSELKSSNDDKITKLKALAKGL
ncbi:MAG: hypothetical protein U0P30_13795 [Vicinamibacterales bacterium]